MKRAGILAALFIVILLVSSVGSAKPDLSSSPEAILFEQNGEPVESILSGDSVNISVRISNTGNEPANFTVAFYDGNPHDGGALIGTDSSHVNASDYAVVGVTWKTAENAKGDHDIWVVIDPDNEVDEINEENNECHRSIFVQIPGSMELGFHVMLVGLTVVLSSLLILSFVLYIFARVVERYEAKHPKPSPAGPVAPVESAPDMSESERAAVISAAIEAYEEDTGGK